MITNKLAIYNLQFTMDLRLTISYEDSVPNRPLLIVNPLLIANCQLSIVPHGGVG